jgi:hypothetical protein
MPNGALAVYVVYENPADYPARFVVRRQWADHNGVTVELDPLIVALTLDDARAAIPRGLYRLPRFAADPPQIVETWL